MGSNMVELNSWQNALFRIGALLVLLGFVLRLFQLWNYNSWVIAVGVVMFSSMQMLTRYEGRAATLLRLRRQQIFGATVYLLMAALMVMQDNQWGPVWSEGNAWILCLAIATVLELYTAFRIPQELDKEKK